MAIEFDFYPNPDSTEEARGYHPRVVSKPLLEIDEILKEINHRCSLTESDVIACLSQLNQILGKGLSDGRTVHLAGLGYFSLKLVSTAQETTLRTRAEHIAVKDINYRPEKELIKQLSTATLQRAAIKKHSALLTDAEVDSRIEAHFTHHHTLTRQQVEEVCSLNRGTALKHINRLLATGRLVNLTNRFQAVYGKGERWMTNQNEG